MRRTDGKLYVGHGGGDSGYTTNTTIQLDSKVAVIVLTNTNDPNSRHIAGQLMSTVGEAVAKAAAPKMDNKIKWQSNWEHFAGRYNIRSRAPSFDDE